jgi:hypothetical protein
VTTTTTTYHLRAITDDSIARVHLGATERANRTWCGVDLLVKGDLRFKERFKDGPGYTASTGLGAVDCGACQRTAAWKGQKDGRYTAPAPKAAAPRAAAKAADAGQVSGSGVIDKDPDTGLPRIRPEYAAKAERIAADQKARNAGKASR